MDSKDSISARDKVAASQDVVPLDDSMRKAERRLRTKIDFFVVPTVTLLYLLCFIDRTNIGKSISTRQDAPIIDNCLGNARLAGFEKDLKLVGYDYNTVLSVFYISYIVFEIPATIFCKVIGRISISAQRYFILKTGAQALAGSYL
jgi:hypothetical protein